MPLEATPDQAAKYLARLDELAEIGVEFSRCLHDQLQRNPADVKTLSNAFIGISEGVRRAIILSCSLEHLLTRPIPQSAPKAAPNAAPTPHAEPNPDVVRHERGDALDRLDHIPDRPLPELIARIERDINAAATILQPASNPAVPAQSPAKPSAQSPAQSPAKPSPYQHIPRLFPPGRNRSAQPRGRGSG